MEVVAEAEVEREGVAEGAEVAVAEADGSLLHSRGTC